MKTHLEKHQIASEYSRLLALNRSTFEQERAKAEFLDRLALIVLAAFGMLALGLVAWLVP